MSILSDWRQARDRRKRALVYLSTITPNVARTDADWLTSIAPAASETLITRELQFARRAIGLIVAERDALDDRTASDVAHQLASVVNLEARRDADAGRAWSERWRAYTGALAARGSSEAPAARLARVMLAATGIESPTTDELLRATQYVVSVRAVANEALRTAFGAASLPEDIRPSAVRPALR